jgi:integrase
MLRTRKAVANSSWVFPRETDGPALGTSLDHQHSDVGTALKLAEDFVIHSLRHTMLTRLGEAGADAFTIMRIAGHSSVTVSQRYVHPTPESLERAFERLENLNAQKFEDAANEQVSRNVGHGFGHTDG